MFKVHKCLFDTFINCNITTVAIANIATGSHNHHIYFTLKSCAMTIQARKGAEILRVLF